MRAGIALTFPDIYMSVREVALTFPDIYMSVREVLKSLHWRRQAVYWNDLLIHLIISRSILFGGAGASFGNTIVKNTNDLRAGGSTPDFG